MNECRHIGHQGWYNAFLTCNHYNAKTIGLKTESSFFYDLKKKWTCSRSTGTERGGGCSEAHALTFLVKYGKN